MKRCTAYVKLTPKQIKEISFLGDYFNGSSVTKITPNEKPLPSGHQHSDEYVPVASILTEQEKKEIAKWEEETEQKFKTFSAY